MNTVTMPGYTADASLHKALVNYQHTATWNAAASKQAIVPQLMKLVTVTCTCDDPGYIGCRCRVTDEV